MLCRGKENPGLGNILIGGTHRGKKYTNITGGEIDGSLAVFGRLVAAAVSTYRHCQSAAAASNPEHTPAGTISEINDWITNIIMGGT